MFISREKSFGVALFTILVAIYMLVYLGIPLSADEISMMDSIQNLAVRQTMVRTAEFSAEPQLQSDGTPAISAKYEPLQIVLGAGLYIGGQYLPNVGQIHIVWMLNLLVTALTAVLLYAIGLHLGYAAKVAWLNAFLFGVATIAFPYSRWFYREPLIALWILLAFSFAHQATQSIGKNQIKFAGLCIGACLLALLTKQATLFILPAIFVFFVPTKITRREIYLLLGMLILFGLGLGIIFLSGIDLQEGRYTLWSDVQKDLVATTRLDWILESILGYQFSPNRSLWLYSPILLGSFVGAKAWYRRGERKFALIPFLALFLLCTSYGFTRKLQWWGGWGWGPRYLIPIIPLFMLLLLPLVEQIMNTSRQGKRWAFGALVALSVAVQGVGLGIPYTNYYTEWHHRLLGDPLRQEEWAHWAKLNWNWRDSLMNYHLRHFEFANLIPAWHGRTGGTIVILFACVLIGYGLWGLRRQARSANTIIYSLGAFGLLVMLGYGGLYSLRNDTRVAENKPQEVTAFQTLNAQTSMEDALILPNNQAIMGALNYLDSGIYMTSVLGDSLHIDTLEQNPTANIFAYTVRWIAEHYTSVWLFTETSAFQAAEERSIEYFLAIHYYPVRTLQVDNIRMIQFWTKEDSRNTTQSFNFRFGEFILLNEATFPDGQTFAPGEVIPLRLYWLPQQTIPTDYLVGVYLIDEQGKLVSQQDGNPQGGFARLSQWTASNTYSDAHGLFLSKDLPAGNYRLFVSIYDWQTQQKLPVFQDDVAIQGEQIALLGQITVTED